MPLLALTMTLSYSCLSVPTASLYICLGSKLALIGTYMTADKPSAVPYQSYQIVKFSDINMLDKLNFQLILITLKILKTALIHSDPIFICRFNWLRTRKIIASHNWHPFITIYWALSIKFKQMQIPMKNDLVLKRPMFSTFETVKLNSLQLYTCCYNVPRSFIHVAPRRLMT
jgi:hypothetical protein